MIDHTTRKYVLPSEIRTERLEQRQNKTDNQIETVKLEMTTQISEVRSEMNQGFSDLRGEMNQRLSDMDASIRQLNQNHIDHLTRHESRRDKSRKGGTRPHACFVAELQKMGI